MAFTRFNYDQCREIKKLQEATGLGRYMLNVPGNGDKPLFSADPFVRAEKWGGNLRTNTINLESDLKGLTRNLNRDTLQNEYKNKSTESSAILYEEMGPYTDQSRATHPAWEVRDAELVNWSILHFDPQENTCLPFQNNLSTRIIEKNGFHPKYPCVNN